MILGKKLYEDTIIDKDKKNNRLLLQSGFKYEDRMKWDQSWKIPENIFR